ncbi:MAG: TIGR02996 domain-containing protein [Mariniblastus sp.]
MQTDETFLDLIDATPQDRDLRLIYADWLTERGDPRGDFLQLEIELEDEKKPTRVVYLNSLLMQLSRKISNPSWVCRVTKNRASEITLIFRKSTKRRLRRMKNN